MRLSLVLALLALTLPEATAQEYDLQEPWNRNPRVGERFQETKHETIRRTTIQQENGESVEEETTTKSSAFSRVFEIQAVNEGGWPTKISLTYDSYEAGEEQAKAFEVKGLEILVTLGERGTCTVARTRGPALPRELEGSLRTEFSVSGLASVAYSLAREGEKVESRYDAYCPTKPVAENEAWSLDLAKVVASSRQAPGTLDKAKSSGTGVVDSKEAVDGVEWLNVNVQFGLTLETSQGEDSPSQPLRTTAVLKATICADGSHPPKKTALTTTSSGSETRRYPSGDTLTRKSETTVNTTVTLQRIE